MTAKPPLPDGYELPSKVNGWIHVPDSSKNGHTWFAPDETATVSIFGLGGSLSVKVFDGRVSGGDRSKSLFETEYDHAENYYQPANSNSSTPAVVEAIEAATRWMERHDPGWKHPAVEEAVFQPPTGFVLDRYFLESRQQTVWYRQDTSQDALEMAGRHLNTEPDLDTRKYLYVETWRGSGNSTISLAPWRRAHDHEKHEVVEPPDECGLAIAVKTARDWVRNATGESSPPEMAGQSDLELWTT